MELRKKGILKRKQLQPRWCVDSWRTDPQGL